MNDQRYRTIAQHYLGHAPEAASWEHLAKFRDMDLQSPDLTKAVDDLFSAMINLLLQLTKGPAYMVTRATPDDNGFDNLRVWASGAADDDHYVDEGRDIHRAAH